MNRVPTFLSWGLCLVVFAALGLALLTLVLAILSVSIGLLAGVSYWLLLAHLGFEISFWLQRSVYEERLSFLARFFKSKPVIVFLCLLYLFGFLHLFLAPRSQ
jgi:ABC-type amino acid transport system permease subunit